MNAELRGKEKLSIAPPSSLGVRRPSLSARRLSPWSRSRACLKMTRARRLLFIAALVLAAWSALAWVAAEELIVSVELPKRADAIVVLSGSKAYVERARRAAQLFHEGRAAKIILTNDNQQSGWSVEQQANPFFIERAAAELNSAGVPADAIEMLPQAVTSTHEEASLLREYASAHGLRSILIVTSAYHSRRALWTWLTVFEESSVQLGLDAVAPGDQTPRPAVWWLQPRGWPMVAGEYFKLIYYRFHYR
ncbi:MAG: hypothetical protein QOF02_1005 [Blastocatellia bacterium]|jgi:uncharacterized SAM-binding protein YcdF (DUF218 family)|nr:hypothetical protein [Blastocatellia bacterium]